MSPYATPHMGSLHSRQCLKCLTPVNTIAILYSSIALITSSSFIEPPGCIIAVIPNLAASSIASRNGKNASEANTQPAVVLLDFDTASLTESTRLICPAPIPTVSDPLPKTIALDLTCLHTFHVKRKPSISSG